MYNNTANTNNSQLQFDSDGFPLGKCIKKAMTKVRQGLDGQLNRGILILNTATNQERWVSVPADDMVAQSNNGVALYFYGKGQRPSLTLLSQHNANTTSGGQYQAQQYSQQASSLGDSIDNGLYQTNNQFDINYQTQPASPQQVKPSNTGEINESVLSAQCLVLTQALALMRELNPQLSEEALVKLAISASIGYQQQMKQMPF